MPNTTSTPQQFHVWRPEPQVRGTFSILSTCILTLFLCVWTSVHLNIPAHGESKRQWGRKIVWLVTALLAPEWIVLTAYCQYSDAKEIDRIVREAIAQPGPPSWKQRFHKLFKRNSNAQSGLTTEELEDEVAARNLEKGNTRRAEAPHESNPKSRVHKWTMTHSFYAAMGGFALDTQGIKDNFLKERRPDDHDHFAKFRSTNRELRQMALSIDGLRLLAGHAPHLLPDLSKAEIQDKSKADTFTKTLACIQATWFCVQCLTRWAQGLFVPLLELNTAAHAICTLCAYFLLWWDKPLNVTEPTPLRDESIHHFGAFMVFCGCWGGLVRPKFDFEPNIDRDRLPDANGALILEPKQAAHGFLWDQSRTLRLDSVDLRCWEMARQAVTRYQIDDGLSRLKQRMVEKRIKNKPRTSRLFEYDGTSFETLRSAFVIGWVVAGLFYGGLHLLAWHRVLRSPVESLLWKVSGVGIGAMGFVVVAAALLRDFTDWLRSSRDSVRDRKLAMRMLGGFDLVLGAIVALGFLFYFFCRVYIVVECFLDTFHLPDSAFAVPNWSQYLPHLG